MEILRSVFEQGFMRARQPADIQLWVGRDGANQAEAVIRMPVRSVGSRSLSVGECT